MNQAELFTALKSLGIPVAYGEFIDTPEVPAPAPPFITYYQSDSGDMMADNQNYVDIPEYQIELYTKKKEPATEKLLTDKLKQFKIPYQRFESPDKVEGMIQIVYLIQLIGG